MVKFYNLYVQNGDQSQSLIKVYDANSYTLGQVTADMNSMSPNNYIIEQQTDSQTQVVFPNVQNAQLIAVNKVLASMAFGRQLIAQYSAQNSAAGMTVAQIEQVMVVLSPIEQAILAGSLATALDMLSKVTPSALIPQAAIDAFSAQIQAYIASHP